ncbi:MAG: virulence factor [Parcubacteria group bacterium Licking1014_17]|nr:MAG: virulence factor [Parcubacteria group bacterium Licking1014_17]
MAITTLVSYLFGILRDRILAQQFGAARALDAYNAAFTAPDLILNIFVAGALTAAFIPIFAELKNRGEDHKQFTNAVLNSSLVVVIIVGLIVFLLAPFLSHLIVPGFDAASRSTFVNLLRILLLSPIIFAISNTLGSMLVSEERFFWYGTSAVLYNVGIIAGTLLLSHKIGIYATAVGAIGGAVLHLVARMIGLWKSDYKFKFQFKLNDQYKRFLRLMAPKMIGHPVEQMIFLGFTIIASTLSAGSIAILNFANKFQSMPINIIGITFALTAFPVLAKMTAEKDRQAFSKEIKFTLKIILLTSVAAAILLYLIRQPLIAYILGGGAFTESAVKTTAYTLGFFSLSIPTESLNHLIARGFYSLKNSITPVIVGLCGLALAVGAGYFFAVKLNMGVAGLALGYFFGSLLKVSVLTFLLRRLSRKYFSVGKEIIAAEIAETHETLVSK